MKRNVSAVLILATVVLLTACSQDTLPKVSPPTFDAAGGTLNFSNGPGTNFMFVFNFQKVPPDSGVEVTITGPVGWNNGVPYAKTYYYQASGRQSSWLNIFKNESGEYFHAVSGDYRVEAEVDGRRHSLITTIDAGLELERTSSIAVDSVSSEEVRVTWARVDGAKSYFVELFSLNGVPPRGVEKVYTDALSATFSGLSLAPGDYYIGVTAFTADLVGTWTLPDGPFNTAYSSHSFSVP